MKLSSPFKTALYTVGLLLLLGVILNGAKSYKYKMSTDEE